MIAGEAPPLLRHHQNREAGLDHQVGPASWFFTGCDSPTVGGMATLTCDFCGRQAEDTDTLTWTTSVEQGRMRRYCDTCSREHLRAMEGKLDHEFW